MIAVKLQAQLGNQLSQYAFVYAAAKRLGCAFYLDRQSSPFYAGEYFDLPRGAIHRLERLVFTPVSISSGLTMRTRRYFYPRLARLLGLNLRDVSGLDLEQTPLKSWLVDQSLYVGWFHGEAFFENAASELRDLLRPRPRFEQQAARSARGRVPSTKKIVAVHVRGGDYADWKPGGADLGDMRLPASYYQHCLQMFDPKRWQALVVTNDESYASSVIPTSVNPVYTRSAEIYDLLVLRDADAVVMSNSSFSWWGAWLGERPERKVLYPEYYHGFRVKKWVGREIPSARWQAMPVFQ